jgi:hypothetical protein
VSLVKCDKCGDYRKHIVYSNSGNSGSDNNCSSECCVHAPEFLLRML